MTTLSDITGLTNITLTFLGPFGAQVDITDAAGDDITGIKSARFELTPGHVNELYLEDHNSKLHAYVVSGGTLNFSAIQEQALPPGIVTVDDQPDAPTADADAGQVTS